HFYIVADELYRYGNEAFKYISRQGRNFNVHLIAAQQDQTDMRPSQRGLMGNASNRVYFQLVPSDAMVEGKEFDATPPWEFVPEPLHHPVWMNSELWLGQVEHLRELERYVGALQTWRLRGAAALTDACLTEGDVRAFLAWVADATGWPLLEFMDSDVVIEGAVAGSQCAATEKPVPWAEDFVRRDGHFTGYALINRVPLSAIPGGLGEWVDVHRPPEVAVDVAKQAVNALRHRLQSFVDGANVFVRASAEDSEVPVARPLGYASDGSMIHRFESKRETGRAVYEMRRRQLRTYSDVERESANELAHLPRQYAKCKLAALGDDPPMEATVKIRQLDPESADWAQRWASIKERSRREYARPVEEVEEEARRRDSIMSRAVETWHSENGGSREYHADGDGLKSASGGPLVRR
ncbi:MAG: hypothetical protein IH978_03570, partial [Nitrospinae bacterium]|nr:hypothetical protein [Nitrospinota bacterium]